MRGPKPPMIVLTTEERQGLEALVRRHTTAPQVALRARMILAAAEGANTAQLARQLGLDVDPVRRWRQRWLGLPGSRREDLRMTDRLTAVPRPGPPARSTAAHVCHIVALAWEAPRTAGRPLSQWTRREMAEDIRQRGLGAPMSPRHAARLVKRGTGHRPWSGLGAPLRRTRSVPPRYATAGRWISQRLGWRRPGNGS